MSILIEQTKVFRQYVSGFKSQSDAAKALGIGKSHLSAMFLGRVPVSKPVMEKVRG